VKIQSNCVTSTAGVNTFNSTFAACAHYCDARESNTPHALYGRGKIML